MSRIMTATREPGGPVHEVRLNPFMIAKYELTQGQWKAVMGLNPSRFKGNDDRPVENLTWDDIQGFMKKTKLRLPAEAEWEYACRGESSAPIGGTGKLDEMGWYWENSGKTTHPVGKKAPNGFGLCDMHGNVFELCEDIYDKDSYMKSAPDTVATSGSGHRCIRGGSWCTAADGCRSWSNFRYEPVRYDFLIGFRPVWRL